MQEDALVVVFFTEISETDRYTFPAPQYLLALREFSCTPSPTESGRHLGQTSVERAYSAVSACRSMSVAVVPICPHTLWAQPVSNPLFFATHFICRAPPDVPSPLGNKAWGSTRGLFGESFRPWVCVVKLGKVSWVRRTLSPKVDVGLFSR